jgi:hypothetical protein
MHGRYGLESAQESVLTKKQFSPYMAVLAHGTHKRLAVFALPKQSRAPMRLQLSRRIIGISILSESS